MRRIVQFCILLGALVGCLRYAAIIIGELHPSNLEGTFDVICALLFLLQFYGSKVLKIASKLSALVAYQFELARHLLSDWANGLARFLETDFVGSSVQDEHTVGQPTGFGKFAPWTAFALLGVSLTVILAATYGQGDESVRVTRAAGIGAHDKVREFSDRWNDLPYECQGCGGPAIDEDDPRLSKDPIPLPRPHPLLRRPRWKVRGR
jgi:hypothetical protein